MPISGYSTEQDGEVQAYRKLREYIIEAEMKKRSEQQCQNGSHVLSLDHNRGSVARLLALGKRGAGMTLFSSGRGSRKYETI